MRKQILLTGAAALAVIAAYGPAQAADPMPIVMAPTTVATYVEQAPRTWTGGYVGGHVGVIRGFATDGMTCLIEGDGDDLVVPVFFLTEFIGDDIDADGPCNWAETGGALVDPFGEGEGANAFFETTIDDGLDAINGYLIGGQIGYLRQLGNGPNGFVIGGEVAVGMTSAQDWVAGTVVDGTIDFQGIFELNVLATATLRAGFAFGPALIYAEGGLAMGAFSYSNNLGFADTDTAHGYVYGGGIEGRISDHVTLFVEYNRVRLNTVQFLGTQFFGVNSMLVDVDTTFNVFKAGFNIQFGGNH